MDRAIVVVRYIDEEKHAPAEERSEVLLQAETVTDQLMEAAARAIRGHPLNLIHLYIGGEPPEEAFAPKGPAPGL